MAKLQHLLKTGDIVETKGWRFEIMDMDLRRVDKVLAARVAPIRRASG